MWPLLSLLENSSHFDPITVSPSVFQGYTSTGHPGAFALAMFSADMFFPQVAIRLSASPLECSALLSTAHCRLLWPLVKL